MKKARLLKLAALLEADAINQQGVQFDLDRWVKPSRSYLFPTKLKKIEVDCGTVACAVGLAAISGAFRRQGLTYGFYEISTYYNVTPKYKDFFGMPAVMEFFDIRVDIAEKLFTSCMYPLKYRKGKCGELAVAKRIRDYVAGDSLCGVSVI